ncbi:trypsin-like peptidase domain-containing protein [Streptomyces sp. NPDC046727]|uniref:S1C family serine protease n=1 Tax=Streptomyces sp. NPDC046727 TaxID=3155373 RepID=UPI0033CEB7FB
MNEGNRVPPVDGPEGAAGVAPADPTVGTDGDFELAKPSPVPSAGTGEAAAAEETTWTPPAERPKPLHDPDPYSTPPYGEPGPWAPAPPVQHPTAAPAHETSVRAATPAHGTSAAPAHGPAVPEVGAAPAHGAAVPAPTAPVPALAAPTSEASLPAPAAPVPAPGASVPAPATSVPAPASAPPALHEPEPAPASAPPTAHVPGPAAPGASVPAPAPHHVPGPATAPASDVPGAPPAESVPQDGGDPWGRYDPWAVGSDKEQALVHGPLQQTGAGVPTVGQRNRRGRRLLLVWTLVVAVVSAGIGGAVGAYVEREGLGDGIRLPQAGSVPAGRAPDSVAGIAARALPSVVTLHVRGADEAGTGTGFVLDAQGHILTNNHVVEPAGSDGEISVTFSSGETVKAKVVGRDSGYDLAVVQVHGVHGLTPLPLGNSDDVKVGDPVVAIGAPFDLANTVTSGIISAKERPITAGGEKSDGSDVSYVDALQTDAPINPGNSGGPLLDSRAQVIGINSAIRSAGSGSDSAGSQSGSIGLGFAIPVNQAKRVAEELINNGHATHPVIGVTLDMGYSGDGARIDSKSANGGPAVTRGGPGERAGLKAGDVITAVGGERVHNGEELIVKIRAHRPGDRLRLTVERGGTAREVSLVLGASEQN